MNKYRQQEVTGRRIHLDSQVYCLIVCLASQTAPASKSNGPIRERIKDSVLKTQVHLCCLQQQYISSYIILLLYPIQGFIRNTIMGVICSVFGGDFVQDIANQSASYWESWSQRGREDTLMSNYLLYYLSGCVTQRKFDKAEWEQLGSFKPIE